MRMGRLLSENVLRKARAREAAAHRRIGWIFNLADVVLAPTTAQPPPVVHDFDHRGGLSTDRAMIRACPVTWPWNLLGWPSINVPGRVHVRRAADRRAVDGPGQQRTAADLAWPPRWRRSTAGRCKQPRAVVERAPDARSQRRSSWMTYQLRRLCPTRSRNVVDHDSAAMRVCAPGAGRRGRRDRGHAGRQRR